MENEKITHTIVGNKIVHTIDGIRFIIEGRIKCLRSFIEELEKKKANGIKEDLYNKDTLPNSYVNSAYEGQLNIINRSIGECRITIEVLEEILNNENVFPNTKPAEQNVTNSDNISKLLIEALSKETDINKQVKLSKIVNSYLKLQK